MRKLALGSIIVTIALLDGCGGGSGSTSSDTSSAPTSIPTSNTNNTAINKDIGTGYYVDEAVEGVDFICGKQEGITDYNGMFRFEHGEGCHFKLGYLNLRDINGSNLEDNISILEDNISVAKLLQTIDKDGNATNGIQILKDTAKILKESNIDSIPQDDALLDTIRENIKAQYQDEYNGTVVTTEDAKAHIERTRQRLEDEGRRTQHSSNIGNAGITLNINGNSETSSTPNETNRESQNIDDNNAMGQGRENGQSRYTDGIVQGGDESQGTNIGNNRESQNINDNNAMEQGRENGESRYTDGIVQGGDEGQGTNIGNHIGESPIGTSQSNNSSESENSHHNNENSSSSSSENVSSSTNIGRSPIGTSQSNSSSESENSHQNNENSSNSSSENVSSRSTMRS